MHPFREQARRRKQAAARTQYRLRVALGVMLGVGMVAALGAVHLLRTDGNAFTARQTATWGEVHVSAADGAPRSTSFLPEAWRRARHPFDPVARVRVLRERRRGDDSD